VLLTAFEPSGDQHAAVVIEELRRRDPDLAIHAWGGPAMERAGATILETTVHDAVMGLPGLAKIREHHRMHKRIVSWAREHRPAVHVPVDSPAANFPICKALKREGASVVHLVAPQLWAWGSWRIRKLRRDTDLVLCLLPFEQEWFSKREVPARFIGHPIFDAPIDGGGLDAAASGFGAGEPRLCLLPGSRPAEWRQNTPLLLEAFGRLRAEHAGAVAVIAAVDERSAGWIRSVVERVGDARDRPEVVVDATDAAIRWSELCVVASGTVTLQIARHTKPMVVFYRANPLMYSLLGRWLIESEFLTLPNLIAGSEIVPEFVPHFGDSRRLVESALTILGDTRVRERQREALEAVCAPFSGCAAGPAAAEAIQEVLRGRGA